MVCEGMDHTAHGLPAHGPYSPWVVQPVVNQRMVRTARALIVLSHALIVLSHALIVLNHALIVP